MIQAVETLLVKFAVFVVNHSFFYLCVCVPRWYHLGTVVPGGTKYGEKNNGMYMPLPLKKTLYKKFTSSCPDSFNAKGKQRERERERERA